MSFSSDQDIRQVRCQQPFASLGRQTVAKKAVVRVFRPDAVSVELINSKQKAIASSSKRNDSDIFELDAKQLSESEEYSIGVTTAEGHYEYVDPYQFVEFAYHAVHFIDHQPENLYRQAGAQLVETENKTKGTRFCVFAPNASSVSVIGDFNGWQKHTHQMQKTDMGYWVLFIPNVGAGVQYKYALKDAQGHDLPDKSDPVGFYQHPYPSHASVVFDQTQYQWNDAAWQNRENVDHYSTPMSIYEVHLGSWRRPDSSDSRYLSYQELADDLIQYVLEIGYTHIEVLPVSEYPFDGSWGYQPVGLFAPTSRFGDPDAFKYFVDKCHQNGLAVIIDWVPAHFPEDPHGLAKFDGSHLYEYEDPRKGWHPDWNSCIYDFGKQTVRQFLVANALFWFEHFHVDGIRVDAVASMLYLDYSRNDGEWIPNVDGGNHNYEAISLLQWMNAEVYAKHRNAVTIAEESTSFAGVSKPVEFGGLGFGFKWNMGWMHDSLTYIQKDPAYRRYHHGDITFSMVYAFDENFILPISHDEVVHGKGSMIEKMPGDEWQKFANLRAYYGFMFAHPGKKLQFMGNEFAQGREWDHDSQLEWSLTQHPLHSGIQKLYSRLNQVYREQSALHSSDHTPDCFTWLDHENSEQSILAFLRKDKAHKECVVVLCNFTPNSHTAVRVGVPSAGKYEVILNTDDTQFSGSGFREQQVKSSSVFSSSDHAWQQQPLSIELPLPPLSVVMLRYLGND